jgi:hypothetical protein
MNIITIKIHNLQNKTYNSTFFFSGSAAQRGLWPSRPRGFRDHTQRHATVGRTSLDEWSAQRRDLYLTTNNTHNREISMPPGGIRTHDRSRQAAVGSWYLFFSFQYGHVSLMSILKFVGSARLWTSLSRLYSGRSHPHQETFLSV